MKERLRMVCVMVLVPIIQLEDKLAIPVNGLWDKDMEK